MNGIAKITIDGQEAVLKFGMPAIRQIAEKTLTRPLIDGNEYNDLGLAHLLYAGYVNGCLMRDEVSVLPFESFYLLVEDARGSVDTLAQINAAVKAFEESKFVVAVVEKLKAGEEKKSPRKTKK